MLNTFNEILILKDINFLQRTENITFMTFTKEKQYQICNKKMYTIYTHVHLLTNDFL